MLSEKNRERLVPTGLYRHDVEPTWLPKYKRDIPYHCMNWTFRPLNRKDGSVLMVDTYFGDFTVEVTDENIDEWEFVFDFTDVIKINESLLWQYESNDLFHVPTDSGGLRLAPWYVRKDAKVSKALMLKHLQEEVEALRREIEWKEKEISRLLETN